MKITTPLFFALVASACNTGSFWKESTEDLSLEKDFNKIEVADAYSILIPKYMKENKELHPDASLAYQNEAKGVYMIVMEEPFGEATSRIPLMDGYEDSLDFVENYLRVNLRMSAGSLQFAEEGEPVMKTINGQNAATASLSGQMEGMELGYQFTCVKGRERIYLIMCWTSAEKKQNFDSTFTKIADSFELVSLVKN